MSQYVRVRRTKFMFIDPVGERFEAAPHMFTPTWHIFRTFTRVSGRAITACGRRADADTVTGDIPIHLEPCRNCLQVSR